MSLLTTLPSVTMSAVRGSEYPTPRRHSPLCSQRAQISMLGSRSFCRSMGQLWMEFSRGPLKKLTAPSSALLCRSQMMTFLAVTVLRVLIVSVCPHLIIYPWVSAAVFHVLLTLHHFFGWFVLGGFSLLHRRNSASKFFYHTNASESITFN